MDEVSWCIDCDESYVMNLWWYVMWWVVVMIYDDMYDVGDVMGGCDDLWWYVCDKCMW